MMAVTVDHDGRLAKSLPSAHALVIGVANYRSVSALPEVVLDDAREVERVLTSPSHCGYTAANVTLLLDRAATLDAIRVELANIASKAKSEDSVVIYFSGHGAELCDPSDSAKYCALVPVDADNKTWDSLQSSVLSEQEFSGLLARIQSKRLVVLLDACHSGGAGTFKAPGSGIAPDLRFTEKALARLSQGVGRVLIASSRASETSLILAGASNSVFTECLVEAFQGRGRTQGDGLIRVLDLFQYISENVPSRTKDAQHPIMKVNDLENNFPVALDRGGVKAASAQAGLVVQALSASDMANLLAEVYPLGPSDQSVWTRAGGDVSRLTLQGNGRTNWFNAIIALRQGGGGSRITEQSLLAASLEDFPNHPALRALQP